MWDLYFDVRGYVGVWDVDVRVRFCRRPTGKRWRRGWGLSKMSVGDGDGALAHVRSDPSSFARELC
jgi:hypothetical protein